MLCPPVGCLHLISRLTAIGRFLPAAIAMDARFSALAAGAKADLIDATNRVVR